MASRGVNKVILVGNLGQDPEVRYMPSGGAVANFTLATSESWRDKQTGEMKEQTEWHRVVLFGKLAEVAGEYLRKGSQVYIEGQLRTRKWTDQSGQDKYTTEVVERGRHHADAGRPSGRRRTGRRRPAAGRLGSAAAAAGRQPVQRRRAVPSAAAGPGSAFQRTADGLRRRHPVLRLALGALSAQSKTESPGFAGAFSLLFLHRHFRMEFDLR